MDLFPNRARSEPGQAAVEDGQAPAPGERREPAPLGPEREAVAVDSSPPRVARLRASDVLVDPLTDLVGPEVFDRILRTESARSVRYRRGATVVLVELDGVEKLLDTWGPDVAASTIAAVGRRLRRSCRESDYLARVAANRFGLILPETDEIAAINFVERARESCQPELRFAARDLRVGFGWASPTPNGTLLDARDRAEARLRSDLVG